MPKFSNIKYLLIKVLMLALLLFTGYAFAKTYLFGVHIVPLSAEKTITNNKAAYENFVAALSKQLQQPVQLVTYPNEKTVQQALEQGKIDLAYLKVIPYAETQQTPTKVTGLVTALTAEGNEKAALHTANIISFTSNNLNDLKGKRFGFVKNSTSGSIYPVVYLQQQGINYKNYFAKVICYKNQYELLQALQAKKIDAGAVWSSYLELNKAMGNFKVIAAIPNIPNPVIAASNKLLVSEQNTLKEGLLKLPSSAFNGLSIVGVQPINNELYQAVIKLIAQNPCA